jgi:DNA polymerase delta subunit 1
VIGQKVSKLLKIVAPIRILSFDIECSGKNGHFPNAEDDSVIQIANYVTVQGESEPIFKNIFVLNDCSSIAGTKVYCFEDEKDMLMEWRNFIISVDPDILTGYNIGNFDLPYLIERSRSLKIKKSNQLGRIKNNISRVKNGMFSSKQLGARATKEVDIDGRVQFDVMIAVQREYKLSSYTLNSVSSEFLGEQKENVHHSIISELQNGNEKTRQRLAIYCLKDAYLPQRLLDKLMFIINYIEMSRVTGIPLSLIITKGQQVKVVSQLLRKAMEKNFLLPTPASKDTTSFEGAQVFDPKCGFYTKPIATLDFTSLYPSIMIAHNLCYTTLLKHDDLNKLDEDDYEKTPIGSYFVKKEKYKGLLPEILVDLLDARKRAKKEYNLETDPFKKSVLNARQLALKISANSVYGFTGAQMGSLPCLQISGSVTAFGREIILKTKDYVEDLISIKNGYKYDAEIIYGDTDSIMVKFGTDDIEEAMKLGKDISKEVSKIFPSPLHLDFEKIFCPFLLLKKKRYAGLKWTNSEKYDGIDAKGIETVRRDNCNLVKNLINEILNQILINKDVNAAINYTKQIISDLLMNKIDISMLVISKSISRKVEDYNSKQTHTELAKRMFKRDPSTAPILGDRVPYVIIKSTTGAKAYEKSEDPIWVLENNIPIDTKYYLEHQLSKPLQRIFETILPNTNILFTGAHTRSISIPTPKSTGILKFAEKKKTCLKCKTTLKVDYDDAVCENCQDQKGEIYQKLISKRNYYENFHSRVWTECQNCQGSLHQDVICSNRDCPVFYLRKKVAIDLNETQTKIDSFKDINDW